MLDMSLRPLICVSHRSPTIHPSLFGKKVKSKTVRRGLISWVSSISQRVRGRSPPWVLQTSRLQNQKGRVLNDTYLVASHGVVVSRWNSTNIANTAGGMAISTPIIATIASIDSAMGSIMRLCGVDLDVEDTDDKAEKVFFEVLAAFISWVV